MSEQGAAAIPGQLDVDEVLELVRRDDAAAAPATVHGELVAPAAELAERFADSSWRGRRPSADTGVRAGDFCAG